MGGATMVALDLTILCANSALTALTAVSELHDLGQDVFPLVFLDAVGAEARARGLGLRCATADGSPVVVCSRDAARHLVALPAHWCHPDLGHGALCHHRLRAEKERRTKR